MPLLVGHRLPERHFPPVNGLFELSKPRITQLVVLTAAAGFYLGLRDAFRLPVFVATILGTALVASGTNAFNMIRERTVDARMRRTSRRPLPSGRVSLRAAVAFGTITAAMGIGVRHGWMPVGEPMVVTKSEEHFIVELNGMPAFASGFTGGSSTGIRTPRAAAGMTRACTPSSR